MFEVVEDHVDLVERWSLNNMLMLHDHKVGRLGYHQKKITHLTLQRKQ